MGAHTRLGTLLRSVPHIYRVQGTLFRGGTAPFTPTGAASLLGLRPAMQSLTLILTPLGLKIRAVAFQGNPPLGGCPSE